MRRATVRLEAPPTSAAHEARDRPHTHQPSGGRAGRTEPTGRGRGAHGHTRELASPRFVLFISPDVFVEVNAFRSKPSHRMHHLNRPAYGLVLPDYCPGQSDQC